MGSDRGMREIAGKVFMCLEVSVVVLCTGIAAGTYAFGHAYEIDRSVNFIACLSSSIFLFAIGRITGGGETDPRYEEGATKADLRIQWILKHGDKYISGSMILVSVINFAIGQPPFILRFYQLINAIILSGWMFVFIVIQAKTKTGRDHVESFIYRAPQRARLMAELPWLR